MKIMPKKNFFQTKEFIEIGLIIAIFIGIFGFLYFRNYNFLSRDLLWDESVYISHARWDITNQYWHPTRSKGIVWFLTPTNLMQFSFENFRLYFLFIYSLLFSLLWYQLYKIWGKFVSFSAVFTALSFWQIQVFSANIYPNSLTMLIGTLTMLIFLRYYHEGGKMKLLFFTFLSIILFELRYAEAICILFGLALMVVLFKFNYFTLKKYAIIFISVGIMSIIPFMYQTIKEYNGLSNRISLVMSKKKNLKKPDIYEHLRLLDGPMSAFDVDKSIPKDGLIWFIGLFVIGICSGVCRKISMYKEFYFSVWSVIGFLFLLYYGWVSAVSMRYFLIIYLLLAISSAILIKYLFSSRSVFLRGLATFIICFHLYMAITFHDKNFDKFQTDYYNRLYQNIGLILDKLELDKSKYKILTRYNIPTCSIATGIPCYKSKLKKTNEICSIGKKSSKRKILIYRGRLKLPCMNDYFIYNINQNINLLIQQ